MGSFNEESDEKHGPVSVDSQEVDTGAQLDASLHAPLDPAEALRIRWVRVRRGFVTLTISMKAENRPTYPTSHVQ
jgi:hypothetical protein